MNEADYPRLFSVTDCAAIRAQGIHFALLGGETIMLLAVAGLSAAWAQVQVPTLHMASSLVLLLVLIIGTGAIRQIRKYDRAWFSCRAIAESVKIETWRFIMRAEPYDTEDRDAERRLLDHLRQLVAEPAPEVRRYLGSRRDEGHTMTEVMRRMRSLPLNEKLKRYTRDRVQDQRRWYGMKAEWNAKREARWFYLSWGLRIGAVTLALVVIFLGELTVGAVGVVTTAAAAGQSWNNARRHRELAQSYSVISEELAILQEAGRLVENEEELGEWVVEVERTISREHTRWVARRIV